MEIFANTPVVDRSGSATTSSSVLAPANPSRRGLEIQNISSVNIGIKEFPGSAAIGSPGTWTLRPNEGFIVRTANDISVVSSSGSANFSATEW